jgi:hypothetical protein
MVSERRPCAGKALSIGWNTARSRPVPAATSQDFGSFQTPRSVGVPLTVNVLLAVTAATAL